ncbi:2Fe-2S iron-sulfur cluster binding domain-containing protein [Pseudomaricurvus sp. HS19]|uniref:2Fe-2S iron-sulfur cluster-binding protein n=1 Tax=Pseudomaricurvus sp. HS19 TaxID=2692626 RepID=UPI00136EB1EC|nr:2Fe-2S iron-sulfur cluster binding domain-containing protein [Pseudomaricurvus sp. HS19]MYM62952.1 2Fe-2S iron-sulfur cluster binding domain-containing protein [Pseudomaricurvus sp. HS19]
MPTITYEDHEIDLDAGENLLEGLEKSGFKVPCSCSSGICQGCIAQALEGDLPLAAQQGLTLNQRRLNYFLTCQCYPETDLHFTLASNLEARSQATLIEKRVLNQRVLLARFRAEMDWRAGQHIIIWRTETRGRTYSIASTTEDGYLEFHVRRRPDGLVSHWLENELQVGEQCQLSPATGDTFYSPAMPGQPVLLVGTGTGLAPLSGILRQALNDGHHGEIYLYAAAGEPQQLYMVDELKALADKHRDLHYFPVVHRNTSQDPGILEGDLVELIPQRHPKLRRFLVYLCGAENMVDMLKDHCFFNGVMDGDLFIKTFSPGG